RYADGLVAARALATEARAVAYRPFQAEALFELGRLQEVTGDYAAAADSLRDAGIDAEAGRDDRIAARAWIQLVWVIGARLGKADEAQTLAREAEAKLERAGADDLMLAELDRVRGQLASDAGKAAVALDYAQRVLALRRKASPDDVAAIALAESDVADALAQQGTYDQAIAQYRDALADMERAVGADHPMRISTLTNLATALRAQAHYDEALAVFDRAEAIAIEVYGPDHPTLATIYMDRGGVERAQGKLDAASAHYDRALAIWTRALGPDHANVGTVHYYRGSVALEQGRIDLAIGEFERARDIWQRALGPDNPSLSAAYAGLGDARLAKGDARGALAAYERGIALIEKALGPTHPDLANGLTGAGLARLALGDPRRAVASLERALAIRVADPGDPVDLARTQFGLARALVAAGGDRGRARDLAEHARAAFAASPTGQREAAAVEAWRARL
ncbi:MAG TPA: tetratricopeptide repeat protein, partial [Kofleriaceae bacterium]|nr:tetratricopeptide repeat protein [Kofleriaceae bacterium]